jgi:hypothetical protein
MSTPLNELTHRISLEKAIKMTTLYRQQKDMVLKHDYFGRDILPLSETFDRKAFDALLAQPGCTAVRVYFSMDDTLKLHLIAVGVNDNNQDILPGVDTATIIGNEEGSGENDDEGIIIEEGVRCPPSCPEPPSPLDPC